jgi:hypothetical protein
VKLHLSLSASAVLMAGLLVGCSGDDGGPQEDGSASGAESTSESESGAASASDYCDALQEAKSEIDALEGGDVAQFEAVFETISDLAEQAPEEVAAEWQTLDATLTGLQDALAEAGLEFADLEALSSGQTPEGVTPQQLQKLAQRFQSFNSPDVNQAGETITQHAEDECGIDLDGSGTEEPSDDASQ